ncbi:hypothetical protein GVN16_23565 [Emticicia sp. CRIBPO]|uniref:hypothetical protein n=1 Tax=Emticicia sp. CRIBPO TaxID=2683258 RepID=UPI0014120FDF|nr:hypothetical protein [Emticicia sp. CRIBPO]NBA88773.1 hypothetical protein [Emticicia sp. CRIBPO]
MFEAKTLKILSIVAIVICVLGSILSLGLGFLSGKLLGYLPVLSWAVLAYASYCAMKLTGYDIYEEDLKKIGWSIYVLFAVFVLFIFVGLSIGPVLAIVMAARLHFQKSTIEEWMSNNA